MWGLCIENSYQTQLHTGLKGLRYRLIQSKPFEQFAIFVNISQYVIRINYQSIHTKVLLDMFSGTLFVLTSFVALAMLYSTRYRTLMQLKLCELCAKLVSSIKQYMDLKWNYTYQSQFQASLQRVQWVLWWHFWRSLLWHLPFLILQDTMNSCNFNFCELCAILVSSV